MEGETFWGRIRALLSGNWRIRTFYSASAVRGTEFTLEVIENGTTTLTVLVGTVEFSDPARARSVLVGPNQTSVILPEGTPSIPTSIDQADIDMWWVWNGQELAEISGGAILAATIIAIVVTGIRGRKT